MLTKTKTFLRNVMFRIPFMAEWAAFWLQHNARPVTNLNYGGHLGQAHYFLKDDAGLFPGVKKDVPFDRVQA